MKQKRLGNYSLELKTTRNSSMGRLRLMRPKNRHRWLSRRRKMLLSKPSFIDSFCNSSLSSFFSFMVIRGLLLATSNGDSCKFITSSVHARIIKMVNLIYENQHNMNHIIYIYVIVCILFTKHFYLYNHRYRIRTMINYLTSFGASSSFEKNRLIITSKSLDAPEQHIMKKILKTFQGEDDETRAQIAYATIIKKILTSDSNNNWIYLLKNLIIIDRILQQTCFVEEICELSLPIIDHYVESNSKYVKLKTAQILNSYWRLIKANAKVMATKKHILYFPRSQRAQFLNTQTPFQVVAQIQPLENLFQLSIKVIKFIYSKEGLSNAALTAKADLEKSKLIQYILMQFTYKFISYYSSEMLCIHRIIFFLVKDQQMEILPLEYVRKFKEQLVKFKANYTWIIDYLERYKDIKGFEVINYRDLNPIPGNLIHMIEKYINERLNFDENTKKIHEYVSQSGQNIQMLVRLKPQMTQMRQISHQPRKKICAKRSKTEVNQHFNNWISSFSEDFPQKEIMTLDLIMTLKNEENRKSSQEQVIIYRERQTCVIPDITQIPQTLLYSKPNPIPLHDNFSNIYSKLPENWNFD